MLGAQLVAAGAADNGVRALGGEANDQALGAARSGAGLDLGRLAGFRSWLWLVVMVRPLMPVPVALALAAVRIWIPASRRLGRRGRLHGRHSNRLGRHPQALVMRASGYSDPNGTDRNRQEQAQAKRRNADEQIDKEHHDCTGNRCVEHPKGAK